MITKNYETLLASVLLSNSVIYGHLPIISVDGLARFMTGTVCDQYSFPCAKNATPTTNAAGSGISVGSGDTAATKDDINLQQTITSGISLSLSATTASCEVPGTPYVEFTITVTNTGSGPITIREVGYKQSIKAASYPGSTSVDTALVYLLDRTVLETPVTIQAGDAGVIKYRLQVTAPTRTKAGVELVSFTWGTDEQICAMIDAARNGDIDLRADGGWRVGDVRTIYVDAFTSGSYSHTAQSMDIVISQFGDYNNCGCLFQFDFAEVVTGKVRLAGSNTNVGGYGETEMYTTTLPALAEALPSWLKTRMKTFDLLVGKGGQSTEIETVTGNKLALRSEVEVLGTTSKTPAGEGNWIAWYSISGQTLKKGDARGIAGASSPKEFWLRSPDKNGQYYFCYVAQVSTPYCNSASPVNTTSYYMCPFGCV